MVKYQYFICIILIFNYNFINAQTSTFDDIKLQKDLFFIDSIKKETNFSNFVNSKSIFDYHNSKKNGFQDLSISFERQRNEKLPFGYNDGSLFPSRGKQERTTFGISFITQNIDLRYQPEIIYAENIDQEPFLGYTADGNWWARYYLMIGNTIDNFNRFTKDKIKNFNLGQSRLGLKNKYLLFGLSTENIWWGPGLRNSIMFTNNSPGFEHIYIPLPKPLNTAIGSFEFYYINGKLRNYNYVNPDNDIMNNIWSDGIYPKKQKDRNISAYNIVYNPRFLKNFYISYSYSNQFYYNDSNAFNIKYSKFSLDKPKYNLGTLAFKFKLPKNNAEFYAEIGQQYLPPNPIYFFTDSNRVAYIIGVRQLYSLSKNIYLTLGIEFTKFALSDPRQIFMYNDPFGQPRRTSLYTSTQIKQGYTNQAQYLGASIGPGSNNQILHISLNEKNQKFKFHLFGERIIYNADFYHYIYVTGNFGNSKADAYWVDMNFGAEAEIQFFKKLKLSTSFISTQSLNYRWVKNGREDFYAEPGDNSDKYNLMTKMAIKYSIF